MSASDRTGSRERTAAVMHATGRQLEAAEDVLHRSAEAAPEEATHRRLDSLGDQVTAEAKAIEARADRLCGEG